MVVERVFEGFIRALIKVIINLEINLMCLFYPDTFFMNLRKLYANHLLPTFYE